MLKLNSDRDRQKLNMDCTLVLEFSLSRLGSCSVYRTEAYVAYAKQAGTRLKKCIK